MVPIPIVKALIQGQPPARRLFVPLIFTLAARLENILLPNFVSNPTKIANNLVALYQRLRPDGVTCYFDLFIVAEALGCRLDWSTSSPTFERPSRENALKMLRQAPGEVKQHGRLPVALEVVHRLQGMLPNWEEMMVALWKTVRFHGGLPVLSTPHSLRLGDQANAPLICLKPALYEQAALPEMPFALALPALGEPFPDVSRWIQARQCVLVITDGEISYQLEIQKLEQRVAAM